jgi:hypothetical protein
MQAVLVSSDCSCTSLKLAARRLLPSVGSSALLLVLCRLLAANTWLLAEDLGLPLLLLLPLPPLLLLLLLEELIVMLSNR